MRMTWAAEDLREGGGKEKARRELEEEGAGG